MNDVIEIAKETGVTLDGYNADFYEYGPNRMMIIERHFSEEETDIFPPNLRIVTNDNFKYTILNQQGKF